VRDFDLEVGNPMDQVSVDICGPFPVSNQGNTVLLVAVDHFTRWIEAYPLMDQTAATCADALYNNMFTRFGCPRILHSDNAPNFSSEIIKELCTMMGTKKTSTAPYSPQSNAFVERANRTILSALRSKLVNLLGNRTDWDQLIPDILMAYRATPHSRTKETPNMMMLGRQVRLPCTPVSTTETAVPQYIHQKVKNMRSVHQAFRNTLTTEDGGDKILLNKQYKEGQLVWISETTTGRPKLGKLEPKHSGPHSIKKKLDFNTYVIEVDGKESLFSASRIREYKGPPTDSTSSEASNFPGHTDVHVHPDEASFQPPAIDISEPVSTRTGRQLQRPGRLDDYIIY
jgi:hypothetical protein